VLKNRKLHCRPILKTFNDNKQLHNKIICRNCSVNSHILASNLSTSLHMDNAWLKMMFKMSTASLHTSWQMTTPLTNCCCDVTMVSSLGTALPSKQEKYLLICMRGPLRWSMPKITKSDAKLSEIYERNEWHLFSRQCNLGFLSTKVLQGSVGTCVNYGRIFINFFTANLLQSAMVKEFWKSVSISRTFFPDTV